MRTFCRGLIFLWVVFLCLSLAGSAPAQTPKRGGTLVIGTEKDPHGMDPHKDVATQGIAILPQIYDGLLNIDEEANVIPGLAEAMPSQPNPVTYIFTLRKGAKFHNGAEFDARDVKFSLDRLMNKDVSRYWKTYQGLIKSVEAVDPYKVSITLHNPNVAFLDMLAKFPETRIVPRGSGDHITQPNGTGPFKFKEWIKDDRLTIVRNDQYWEKGLPYLDQVVYKPFPEETTRALNLKTGVVDAVHKLPIQSALSFKKEPRIRVIGRSGGEMEQMWLNTTKPPFDNRKVRQAVAYGIDRQAIADSVFLGYSEVAQDLFPKWFWAHNPAIKAYPHNPEKAKALLREAGYTEKNPLTFTIICTNEPIFTDQAVIIQAQLAKIGVKVKVLPAEKSFWFDAQLGRKGRDMEASLEDTGDDMTDLQWVYRNFSAKSYYNYTGFNSERYGKKGVQNPEAERLMGEVVKLTDRAQARKIYDQLQALILEDIPIIRLSYYQNIVGLRDHVKDHQVFTRNTFPLKKVWLAK